MITRQRLAEAQHPQRAGQAEIVTQIMEDLAGPRKGLRGGSIVSGEPARISQAQEGVGVTKPVTQVGRGARGGSVPGPSFRPWTVGAQQMGQPRRQGDHPGVLAFFCHLIEEGQESEPFRAQPCLGLVTIGEIRRDVSPDR